MTDLSKLGLILMISGIILGFGGTINSYLEERREIYYLTKRGKIIILIMLILLVVGISLFFVDSQLSPPAEVF